MYAPPFIPTPALRRALQLAAEQPPVARATLSGLPDELFTRIAGYCVETRPLPSPRYVHERGIFLVSRGYQPLRHVDRRGARLLPPAEPTTFRMPLNVCTVS